MKEVILTDPESLTGPHFPSVLLWNYYLMKARGPSPQSGRHRGKVNRAKTTNRPCTQHVYLPRSQVLSQQRETILLRARGRLHISQGRSAIWLRYNTPCAAVTVQYSG
ncbi:hypothetical protein SCLCIDRAFT_994975 [Scleroderma citrinum Foug A]|uniref:Uncharacterized protein n=1 Tax=Scleroderma citrinum Foug A TaxID=1036808 RepID=A0A0C3DUB8_9AGAM|nr:hypothetical protein SCLCIDRAFT_994975 [Scleroderma citrinum Foug A]